MRPIILLAVGILMAGCGSGEKVSRIVDLPPSTSRPPGFNWTAWAGETNSQIRATAPLNARGEMFIAYRTALAAEVDAGRLSPEQMDLQTRSALAAVVAADQAQRDAAFAQISQGLSQAGAAMTAASQTNRLSTNCSSYRIGNTIQTNCH